MPCLHEIVRKCKDPDLITNILSSFEKLIKQMRRRILPFMDEASFQNDFWLCDWKTIKSILIGQFWKLWKDCWNDGISLAIRFDSSEKKTSRISLSFCSSSTTWIQRLSQSSYPVDYSNVRIVTSQRRKMMLISNSKDSTHFLVDKVVQRTKTVRHKALLS